MIITKVLEHGFNVENTINLYVADDNIKDIVAHKMVGRCFRGCWIQSVDRVIKSSDCVINQDGEPNFGTISVIFEVTAIVYTVGEVIHGCRVINRDASGFIVCQSEVATLIVKAHKLLDSVVKDQLIPLRVGSAKYNQGAPKIVVNGIPFTFADRPTIYKIGVFNDLDRELFANVLSRIAFEESEMNRIKGSNAKAWEFFEQLLCAYREPQSAPLGAQIVSVVELIKIGGAYVSRDSRLPPTGSGAYVYAAAPFPDGALVNETIKPANAMLHVLEDYCAGMRNVREMIGIYSTPKLISDHKNLWQIFAKSKLDNPRIVTK